MFYKIDNGLMNERRNLLGKMRNDGLRFFYKKTSYVATYEEFYLYLKSLDYNLSKDENAIIKYYDENVLLIFNELTGAGIRKVHFSKINNPHDPAIEITIGEELTKNRVFESHEINSDTLYVYEESLKVAESKRIVQEKELERQQEKEAIKKREYKTFEITENSYSWAKTGIWSTVILASIQIGISIYDVWWKDFEHETKMIQLDSIQVEQNKKIIELLEQNHHKDSVIAKTNILQKK